MTRHLLLAILCLLGPTAALSTPGEADDRIPIALMAPYTGPLAVFGQEMAAGFKQAVADINDQGGLLGQQIEGVVYDDRCQPEQGEQIARRIVELKQAALVIGPACSATAQVALRVFGRSSNQVVDALSFAAMPALTDQGYPNVFRVVPRADRQGRIASEFLQKLKGNYDIAILNDETPYAADVIGALRQAWPTMQNDTKVQMRYSFAQNDFSGLIAELRATSVRIVYVAGLARGLGRMLVAAREQNYPALFVASDQAWSDELWRIAGESANGVLFTFYPDPARNAQTAPVADRMRKEGHAPTIAALYTYAAVQMLAQATVKAGSVDAIKIAAVLHEGQFDTVIGPVAFDPKGDIKDLNYEFYRWQQGTSVQLNDRPPPPPPPPPTR